MYILKIKNQGRINEAYATLLDNGFETTMDITETKCILNKIIVNYEDKDVIVEEMSVYRGVNDMASAILSNMEEDHPELKNLLPNIETIKKELSETSVFKFIDIDNNRDIVYSYNEV